jgi:hypothetical protein
MIVKALDVETQKLTQEYLQSILHYDKDTGIFTWKKINKNSNRKLENIAGSFHNKGYRHIRLLGKLYLEHRLAWFYQYGYFPKEIDHIDGNKLNNCIFNLREVTRSQNMMNTSPKRKNSSTGIKGVSWYPKYNKWVVRIQVNGKRKCLGYFEDLEFAELVATEAREKYHAIYSSDRRNL